jgi:hypothetical protein
LRTNKKQAEEEKAAMTESYFHNGRYNDLSPKRNILCWTCVRKIFQSIIDQILIHTSDEVFKKNCREFKIIFG